MKREQRFWEVDLIELARDWLSQILIFFETALAFIGMAIPVLIPMLVLWYLAGFPSLFKPFK